LLIYAALFTVDSNDFYLAITKKGISLYGTM
jgi:hypothetical protein